MAVEAKSKYSLGMERFQAEGLLGPHEVFQTPSGQAGVLDQAASVSTNSYAEVITRGTYTVKKTGSAFIARGQRVYWDYSANEATYRKVNDRDFYVGRAAADASTTQPWVDVLLNEDPPYDIDIMRDACLSVPVGTQAVGAFGYPKRIGGSWLLELTATNEAQKVDLLSVDGFDLAANAVVEAIFSITNDGSNATQDFTIGVASGTHASDFQSITSFVAVSTVGNSTNINAQSDDNVTDVAPVDTTADYVEGSAVANRVHVLFDFRTPGDVQIYVNGALVLEATTFTAGTSGLHFLIAHLEKTTGTDVYAVRIDALRAWFSE